MRRYRCCTLVLGVVLSALLAGPTNATIVYHVVNYTGTVAGGDVAFDFTDGSATPGALPPSLGMRLIPSNGGGNMQIQFLSGRAGES